MSKTPPKSKKSTRKRAKSSNKTKATRDRHRKQRSVWALNPESTTVPKKAKRRSHFEDTIEKTLKQTIKNLEYEPEAFTYVLERKYTPDFYIPDLDIYLEAKGLFTSADRTKMLNFKRQYPTIDIRLIFMQDNWLSKKRKKRYSEWAKDNGFPYSVWPHLPF